MAKKIPIVTLDTNSIIDWVSSKDDDVRKLMQFHEEGRVCLKKTDVMDTELKTLKALDASAKLDEVIGYGVVGSSRIDHSMVGDDNVEREQNEILKIVFPSIKSPREATERQIRDVMHLHTHRTYGHDYFITRDNNILQAKQSLREKGIIVMSPKELVSKLADRSSGQTFTHQVNRRFQ